MMRKRKRRAHRLLGIVWVTILLGWVAGCDGPTDSGAALGDFVIDFARSAWAAFLL